MGKITPVTVVIKNTGNELTGILELRTGTGFSVLVRREVVLPQDTEKRFVLFVATSGICKPKDFEVQLIVNGGTIASGMPQALTNIDPDKSLVRYTL